MTNSISQIAKQLKDKFSLKELPSYEALEQNGEYLVFEGFERVNESTDNAIFGVIIAANTLNADKSALLPRVDEMRRDLFRFGASNSEYNVYGAKAAFVTNALYCVKFNVKIKIAEFID